MAELKTFRSAFNGFNREDVVQYIEYLNNTHNAQVNQLKTELETVQGELALARMMPSRDNTLPEKLSAAEARCAELEQELTEVRAQLAAAQEAVPAPADHTAQELEAYRRAERTERMAQERAKQLHDQLNGILADTTAKVDEAAEHITGIADQTAAQLEQLRQAVLVSKTALADAAASMYAIRPVEAEE